MPRSRLCFPRERCRRRCLRLTQRTPARPDPRAHIYSPRSAHARMCGKRTKRLGSFGPLSSHQETRWPSSSMGQLGSKAKQGGELTTADKTAKSNEAKKLVDFMEKHYDSKFKDVQSFDEFYHAIYEIIEMYCEEHGQFQYKIPDKKILEEQYKMVNPRETAGRNLKKEEFIRIAENVVSLGSFTAGTAAIHVLTVLFGAPVCALFVKRVLPGLRSLSDDVVIPVATSGAVVYLAKANKL